MLIRETGRGVEIETGSYRLLLERTGGYAAREVTIRDNGRLDRFDRPGEGPHPTCMYFDNCTINYDFQMGFYGKTNTQIEAEVEQDTVILKGTLLPITESPRGRVQIEKTIQFGEDSYDVSLQLGFEDTGAIHYASVWWDVHDKWLKAMRSSAGTFLPLQVGIGDSFDDFLHRSWRPMPEMDRGAGTWMEMIGERTSVMTALLSASPCVFQAGGMKYWDGPDDADAGEGVSHGCINLDLINCELSQSPPLKLDQLEASYRVFLSPPSALR